MIRSKVDGFNYSGMGVLLDDLKGHFGDTLKWLLRVDINLMTHNQINQELISAGLYTCSD